jgi:hypothetical protein
VLAVEEDKGGGGDGTDAPGTEADPAQSLEGRREERIAAFAGARMAACSRFTVH